MVDHTAVLYGSVVVNEMIFAIEGIHLRDSRVFIAANRAGPCTSFEGGTTDIRVFGEDGTHIIETRVHVEPWDDVRNGDWLHILLPIHLSNG